MIEGERPRIILNLGINRDGLIGRNLEWEEESDT